LTKRSDGPRGIPTRGENMDLIIFLAVLLLAYFVAHLIIKYDNKRIEAECKFTKRSAYTDEA
jgi:hypothetical protein